MPIETSRRQQMKKKKKANLLINSLIGIVGLLILITLVNLLSNNSDVAEEETSVEEQEQSTEQTEDEGQQEVESEDLTSSELDGADEDGASPDGASEDETTTEDATNEEESTAEGDTSSGEVVTEPSTDPIVKEAFTNSAWQPIGTSQTGTHTSSYDPNSVDWAEKVRALSYASGLSEDNMYIKFLGNGGSPQKSIGTITSKDESEKYRVYLEWVDGQGWKPTKVEVLNQLP